MSKINPYLSFNGNAREAMNFYKTCIGGELAVQTVGESPMAAQMPETMHADIMHSELRKDGLVIMGSDMVQNSLVAGNNVSLMLECSSEAEINNFFSLLSEGGQVRDPLKDQFWGAIFGTLTDKFGINWLLNYPKNHNGHQSGSPADDLVIERVFEAPRDRVWQAWSDPELTKQWWGPEGFTAPFCRIDFHQGGTYLYCMRSPEGKDYWSTGTYREIVPLERIVCTDSFADEQGAVVPASYYGMNPDFPLELQVTLVFEAQDNRTRLTLRHAGIPGADKEMCAAGWNSSLDKLAGIL